MPESQTAAAIALRQLFRSCLLVPVILGTALAHAQGGPPFIADDPGTPGNRNWEINLGWIGSHNPGQSAYQIPDVDINYGWGDRIQLKYELALDAATDAANTTRVGLGDSFPGIKVRFYEHYRAGEPKTDENLEFSLGSYPQVLISNPTRSVQRGVVAPGPQYYLPIEVTAKLGPIALNGELGRWIGNKNAADQWGRGLIAGHEFSDRFELYAELYDLQTIDHTGNEPRPRSFTLDVGGRKTLDHNGHLRLLFMGGRAIRRVTAVNGEPGWIAYAGFQFLFGPKNGSVSAGKP